MKLRTDTSETSTNPMKTLLTLLAGTATVLMFSTGCMTHGNGGHHNGGANMSNKPQAMSHDKPDAGKHKKHGAGDM